MGQDLLVNELLDDGWLLIEKLAESAFEVETAFWAKPADEGKWYLHLSSSFVSQHGPLESYQVVNRVLRQTPELRINPFEVRLLELSDALATAARAVIKPRISTSPFAVPNPRHHTGWTYFGGSTLAGVSIDGAYIYPPRQPKVTA